MPAASIVIPCYNAARFVRQTVASAQAQSVADIQIVCVNDGSTDDTGAILRQLASEDSRIRIIDQQNAGEGPARDAGLCAATGTWLYFLDADDIMEPQLLERAMGAGERDASDLVVFRTLMLNEQTGEEGVCAWSFKRDWMPNDYFCPREHPEHVFTSFQNWVHNKLFRGSFVRSHDLRFQHVHRTADLLFTCRAMAEAGRVSLLDEPLHHYRVNNPSSAMATSDSYPLDFLEGFAALRASLEHQGTWELYHDSYVNWVIDGIVTNLRLVRSYEGFAAIASYLTDGGFDAFDVSDFPREKSDNLMFYDLAHTLRTKTVDEALFGFMWAYRNRLGEVENELSRCRMELCENQPLNDVMNSASFRIGRAITSLPRTLRDRLASG